MKQVLAILLFIGPCLPAAHAQGGAQDALLRQQLTLAYKTKSKFTVAGKYFLYLKDNVSRFDKSVLGLEVNYKLFKWLEAGVEYRYAMDNEQDGHTFRYALEAEYAPKKKPWRLKWRTLLEQELHYFDADYLAANPIAYTWRNRLIAARSLHKKLDVYAMLEGYTALDGKNRGWAQANYGVGTDYQLKRRHSFNVEVQYRDYFKKKKNADVVRIDVGYKLTLGYQKSKKKKQAAGQTDGVGERLGE